MPEPIVATEPNVTTVAHPEFYLKLESESKPASDEAETEAGRTDDEDDEEDDIEDDEDDEDDDDSDERDIPV